MPYGKMVMKEGVEVIFEVEVPVTGHMSSKGFIDGLREDFDRVISLVQVTTDRLYSGFQSMPDNIKPDEYEVTFGIKISADAGIVFANIGNEGLLQVTLRWTK